VCLERIAVEHRFQEFDVGHAEVPIVVPSVVS
jgi:hypothetical protein